VYVGYLKMLSVSEAMYRGVICFLLSDEFDRMGKDVDLACSRYRHGFFFGRTDENHEMSDYQVFRLRFETGTSREFGEPQSDMC
jgi:hypothetical protein